MIKTCIVREPCMEMVKGLSSAGLGVPEYEQAIRQHEAYVRTLEYFGCRVIRLPADPNFPDSVFVEDVALMLGEDVAVITRPGAESRRGETADMRRVLEDLDMKIEEIREPGTLDAGDVLEVEDHYFIGISERTNPEGAEQLIRILLNHKRKGSKIRLKEFLHLKTGVAYLGNRTLLVSGELKDAPEFENFRKIEVDDNEAYAANSIMVNGRLILPEGYPETESKLIAAGYDIFRVDTSEFRKLDGGLSCLSLRF